MGTRNVLDAIEARLVISPPVDELIERVDADPATGAFHLPHELEAHRHLVEEDLPALIAELRRLRPLLRRCAEEGELPHELHQQVDGVVPAAA